MTSDKRQARSEKRQVAGMCLIDASAGTGKTHRIEDIYVELVLDGLEADQILVVTFTEAATQELRDRIRSRLRREIREGDWDSDKKRSLQEAVSGFDNAAIFTIHGFCSRMLEENAFESGSLFNTKLIKDQSTLIREVVDDFWRRHFYNAHLGFVHYALNNGINRDSFYRILEMKLNNPDAVVETAEPGAQDMGLTGEHAKPVKEVADLDKLFIMKAKQAAGLFKKAVEKGLMDALMKAPLKATHYGNLKKPEVRSATLNNHFASLERFFIDIEGGEALLPECLEYFAADFLAGELSNLRSDSARQQKFDELKPYHPLFKVVQELNYCRCKLETLFQRHILFLKKETVEWGYSEIGERKKAANIRSFNDMLTGLRDPLVQARSENLLNAIRGQYKAAIIDEFQDTDPVQYEIFSTLFDTPETCFYMIGDPKQSIYSFRGADIHTYQYVKRVVAKKGNIQSLKQNWRSADSLVKAFNAIFTREQNVFHMDGVEHENVEPADKKDFRELVVKDQPAEPFRFWYMQGEAVSNEKAYDAFAQATANEISRLLDLSAKGRATLGGEPLQPQDMTVLVPSHMLAGMQKQKLNALGIPAVIQATGSLFETREALEIFRVIQALLEPTRQSIIRNALATSLFNYSEKEIVDLEDNDAALQSLIDRFVEYHDACAQGGIYTGLTRILEDYNVRERFLRVTDGERRVTNLSHVMELMEQARQEQSLSLAGVQEWLAARMQGQGPGDEEHELMLESDDNAVTIMTLHKCKGLQFPIVFVPFSWKRPMEIKGDFLYHNESSEQALRLRFDRTDTETEQAAYAERMNEATRLVYVAITRARNHCYVMYGNLKNTSPFYDELFAPGGNDSVFKSIKVLEDKAPGAILVEHLPGGTGIPYTPVSRDAGRLSPRKFRGSIEQDWLVSSFTGLTAGVEHEHADWALDRDIAGEDRDVESVGEAVQEQTVAGTAGVFAPGAGTGNFFHDVFENLDYTLKNDEEIMMLIEQAMALHLMFYGDVHLQSAMAIVKNVLNTPIGKKGSSFRLSEITWPQRINEMEFYYPVQGFALENLIKAFEACGLDVPGNFDPGKLNFARFHGFIHGFMDLVFVHDNKYYLLDWKSNHLGDNVSDYTPDRLAAAMEENCYNLQYLVYAVGLDRHLSRCLEVYDYDKHFGGVVYVFLRGVDPQIPGNGIYFHKPEKKLIRELGERF